MKFNRFFQVGLMAALAVSCVAEQNEAPQVIAGDDVIVAGIENSATRVSVDENLQVLWDKGDCISVFRLSTINKKYQLQGEGGVNKGTFAFVSGGHYGADFDKVYALYPYDEAASLTTGGVFTLTLPAAQTYAENGFGPEANVMVAASKDKSLSFKNVGGFIGVRLVGDAAVKSITLRGNAGEPLAGKAEVKAGIGEDPVVTFSEEAVEEVVLTCEPAVQLSMEDTTLFWIVVPPTEFAEGISVSVAYEGAEGEGTFEKEGAEALTIERNTLVKMAPLCIKTQKELTVKRLWGKYPNSGWPTDVMGANEDRCVATDGEWIYVAQAGAKVAGVKAISIADPTQVKDVNTTGVEGGFFATSCVRTIWDPQTEKYILLLSNMVMDSGTKLTVYAYENGTDAAPTKVVENTIWGNRRFGDFFTVAGDWNKGYLYFRNNNATDPSVTARFNIEGGKVTNGSAMARFDYGYGGSKGMGSFYLYSVDATQGLLVTDAIGMFFPLNSQTGLEWKNGDDYSVWAKNFGITPFEFNGEKYIAYHHMHNAARGWLRIINDINGTAAGFMETLIANDIVFEGAVQIEKDEPSTEVVSGATYSGNTMGNCSVAYVEDGVILVAHQQNTGIAVFKMSME